MDWKSFLYGVVASLLAGLFLPAVRRAILFYFIHAYQILSGNVIDLTDTWEANFCEKDDQDCKLETTERIKIKQTGLNFSGVGEIGPPHQRTFNYTGQLYQELVFGFHTKAGSQKGSLEGRGLFLLKLDPNRKNMSGYSTWHDLTSNDVEISKYEWKRS